jgi:cytochrome c oxidase subunit II
VHVRRSSRGRGLGALAVLGGLLLCGCAGQPAVLDPRGPAAARITDLWWLLFWLGAAVFAVVMAALAVALFRRRRADTPPDAGGRLVSALIGGGGIAMPIVVLAVALVATVLAGRALAAQSEPALIVEVTGHQYWWEIHYPEQGFTTANELHIPAGQVVEVRLRSADVIHSFWVPQLHGKIDMVPGHANTIRIQADAPGEFLGQCAEFCGQQHTLMKFLVIAEEPGAFDGWVANQQRLAREPTDELLRQGQQVFLGSSCVYCHVIRGTTGENAGEAVGPDLTHLASRRTLAAGVLANNRGNLGGWIIGPQAIKPGNRMPGTNLSGEELQALLAYLESLE